MRHRVILAMLIGGGMTTAAAALAQTPSPAMLAGTCAACHGTNGSSVGITPSIAGSPAEYFIETMQAFREGTRKSTVMGRIAKGYTDEEIKAMAGFFAQQKPVPQKQSFDVQKASLGRKLHEQQCEKCHEDGGRAADEGGILAGQSMLYLQYTMEDFRDGHREAPKKMRKRVEAVLESDGAAGLEALLHYYASQN